MKELDPEGEVTQKFPALIKKIAQQGHEIASHGFYHKQIFLIYIRRFYDNLLLQLPAAAVFFLHKFRRIFSAERSQKVYCMFRKYLFLDLEFVILYAVIVLQCILSSSKR